MRAAFICLAALALASVAAVAVAGGNDDTAAAQFAQFKATFGKRYANDAEEAHRFAVFKDTIARVEELNAASEEGGAVHSAMTKFADLTPGEFSDTYLKYKPDPSIDRDAIPVFDTPAGDVPTSKDWRKASPPVMTPVKNQEQCGSCWAFSTAEEIESMWALAGNKLVALSPQQIVSCDKTDDGCNGGDTISAYAYVEKAGGLDTQQSYPYRSGGGNSGRCKFNSSAVGATMTGYKYATKPSQKDETAMKTVVGTTGPLSICVDASSWQTYSSGIIKNNCGQQLDHCVQIGGYHCGGSEVAGAGSSCYWLVRNSWGEDWGYSGYLRIEMGKNLCGIADEATIVEIN